MFSLRDLAGLVRDPLSTLARIDGKRLPSAALMLIALSVILPALCTEVAALAPFAAPIGLGDSSGEIRLLSDTFFRWLYAQRFLIPAVDAGVGIALWLIAIGLIHVVARRLGGVGTMRGYLALCGPIALIGTIAVPALGVEALLRASGHGGAADTVSSIGTALSGLAFVWQNVLLVMAAAVHYRLPADRAITAVVGPAAGLAVLLVAVVIAGTVLAVMALVPAG